MLYTKSENAMKVIALLTEHAVVVRIIEHLKLRFIAEKRPPSRIFSEAVLMAAKAAPESLFYFIPVPWE